MFDLQAALAKGMYVELLEDWFKLFAREQFLVLNFETYMDDKFSMLHRIYAFLDTGKIPTKHKAGLRWYKTVLTVRLNPSLCFVGSHASLTITNV